MSSLICDVVEIYDIGVCSGAEVCWDVNFGQHKRRTLCVRYNYESINDFFSRRLLCLLFAAHVLTLTVK